MNASEVRGGLRVDEFVTKVSRAQDQWVVDWCVADDDGVEMVVGRATFREIEDGIEWTRFNVDEEWQGHGLYSKALAFSADHGRAFIADDTPAREFYLQAGFKAGSKDKDGWLVQDKRLSKSWLARG